MTTRSDMNANSSSNHHPLHPRDDRETLSALFDGELPGDAMRFALKRLDHDAGWRETCGRWQLIGDALRGEATSVAPAGFAIGVMQMLAAETQAGVAIFPTSPHAMDAVSPVAAGARRRWMGGAALAASVAIAAVLVVRPSSQPSSAVPDAQVAAEVVAPAAAPAPVSAPIPAPMEPGSPASAGHPGSAIAVAGTSPPPATHRSPRGSHAALRPVRSSETAPVRPSTDEPAVAVAAADSVKARQPFHPPADEIVTRPWPRAVLSEGTAAGALTVGFGSSSSATSSFYPFEPRLPPETPSPPQTVDPQR